MAKINKTSVYNYDDNVGKNDFLIGSDNDNGNITFIHKFGRPHFY